MCVKQFGSKMRTHWHICRASSGSKLFA